VGWGVGSVCRQGGEGEGVRHCAQGRCARETAGASAHSRPRPPAHFFYPSIRSNVRLRLFLPNFFDLWSAQGKDPTGNWKICGGKAVKRVYEKNVKGYVYAISGGPGHKMQLPKDERRGREYTLSHMLSRVRSPHAPLAP
jgi:hypothetical protein